MRDLPLNQRKNIGNKFLAYIRPVPCDPLGGERLLTVAHLIHIRQGALDAVGIIRNTVETYHAACGTCESSLNAIGTRQSRLFDIGRRTDESRAALVDVQLYGSRLDTKMIMYKIFQENTIKQVKDLKKTMQDIKIEIDTPLHLALKHPWMQWGYH